MSGSATILPLAETQFIDTNGHPLAGGSVFFYVPGTTTLKTTWQDAAQTIANPNPVILDAAGRALIYGVGTYRQQVFDAMDNLIWDQVTGLSGDLVFAAQFLRVYTSQNNGYTQLPDGTIEQICTALVSCGGGDYATNVTLPLTFPNSIQEVGICFGGNSPPGADNPGSISVLAINNSTVQVTTNYAGVGSLGVIIKTKGW